MTRPELVYATLQRAGAEGASATQISERTGLSRGQVLRCLTTMSAATTIPGRSYACGPKWTEESVWTLRGAA